MSTSLVTHAISILGVLETTVGVSFTPCR